ncbi:MAG: hypothetical protein CMJ83_07005 [Planctomycetes bacterium]|nr:hypothetical protein [Planctomycetota bacterium]
MRSLSLLLVLGAVAAAQIPPPPLPTVGEEAPHLFHGALGTVTARWIQGGAVKERRFGKGRPIVLPEFRHLLGERLVLETHTPPPSTWPMPKRLLAISDMEGEYVRMRTFLRNHGVIDSKSRWSFGKGHLVCVGDMVDRGTHVTETLWLLHRLEREARKAGGRLHFVLGNHEAMMMGGDVRYTAPKYAVVAQKLGITIPGLLGADTEIGRWLRQQNAIVRIGDVVFVHAGLAPDLVRRGFDYDKLNALIRGGLGTPPAKLSPAAQVLMWGRYGPLWYRGYFPAFAATFGPTPTEGQLTAVVKRLKAKMIVVGHTKVEKVGFVDPGKKVLAIDTTWTKDSIARGVLIEKDRLRILSLTRESKVIPRPGKPAPKRVP